MKTRIYIMACESERRFKPTFDKLPTNGIDVALHVLSIDELETMSGEECRAMLIECVQSLPKLSGDEYKFPLRTPNPVPDQPALFVDDDPGYDPDDWRSSVDF